MATAAAERTLADALVLAGRAEHAAALEAVERALEAAPDSVEAWLAKGRILRAAGGEHGALLRAFRRATECGAPPLRRAEALREYALALEPIGRWKEAAAALEDATQLAADAPAAWRAELSERASRAHERSGDDARALDRHRRAEPRYREELRDLPAFYAREAELLERLGRLSELFACYARLVEAAPDRVLFAQADETRPRAAARERLRRLLHGLNEHIRTHPDDLVARIVKAGLFFRLGRYRHAEQLILRGIETAHDHFYAYHLLAKIRLRTNRPGAALEAIEKARPLAPDYLDLERDRAQALEGCDRKAEALEVYRRIETRWPGGRDLLARAARLREELGLLEDAYDAHRRAAHLAGGATRESLSKLAELAARLDRPREAEAHLEAALALAPEAHELRLARADLRAAASDPSGALAEVDAVLCALGAAKDGTYREALARKVALLARLDRGADAVAAAEELCALVGGEDERALVLRGDALRAARRFPESVEAYKRAADKKLAETLLDAGARLFEQADFPRALGKLNESFRRNPQSWEVLYFAAAAYARLGQATPAGKYLAAAAKLNKGAVALMEQDRDFDAVRGAAELAALGAPPGGGS